MVNSHWLARQFIGTIRAMPSIKINEFKKLGKEQIGWMFLEHSAEGLRRRYMICDSKMEYAMLWGYVEELRRSN